MNVGNDGNDFRVRHQADGAAITAGAGPQASSQKPIIVVELFTAEGCSDCPPADELLATIVRVPLTTSASSRWAST